MKELSKDELLGLIYKINFFKTFTPEEKFKLADIRSHLVSYVPNAFILIEGDPGDALYILLKGQVYITKSNSPGVRLAELVPGAIFGEVSFLSHRPRLTNVRADAKVLALRIDPEFLEVVGPEIAWKVKDQLLTAMVDKLDRMNLVFQEAKRRIPGDEWYKRVL
ncbi:MAG: cyclic nucleotide-binding domain-containing protein [Candidatus Nitrohelix vancouverensis]|uniref:Cyclic nucleotide-binding domain-containing protein n=1 Tax=Candidatus Nitrohelix vancouverensis TaxID=2705534 RepID=A0A7T0G3X7_9BACT|nr:MAG: cyclic nucleotide-binding domain-containing protein [Candidatus Nitrohelix vancouverensis]